MTTAVVLVFAMTTLSRSVPAQEGSGEAAQSIPDVAPLAEGVRTDRPPAIDGVLGDPAWAGAPIITGFLQREPFEGQPATERAEVRILFDDEALYVGVQRFDGDPGAIVLGEARRWAEWQFRRTSRARVSPGVHWIVH